MKIFSHGVEITPTNKCTHPHSFHLAFPWFFSTKLNSSAAAEEQPTFAPFFWYHCVHKLANTQLMIKCNLFDINMTTAAGEHRQLTSEQPANRREKINYAHAAQRQKPHRTNDNWDLAWDSTGLRPSYNSDSNSRSNSHSDSTSPCWLSMRHRQLQSGERWWMSVKLLTRHEDADGKMERWKDIADIDTMHTEWGIGIRGGDVGNIESNWKYPVALNPPRNTLSSHTLYNSNAINYKEN